MKGMKRVEGKEGIGAIEEIGALEWMECGQSVLAMVQYKVDLLKVFLIILSRSY